jgi:hypothetical protein
VISNRKSYDEAAANTNSPAPWSTIAQLSPGLVLDLMIPRDHKQCHEGPRFLGFGGVIGHVWLVLTDDNQYTALALIWDRALGAHGDLSRPAVIQLCAQRGHWAKTAKIASCG